MDKIFLEDIPSTFMIRLTYIGQSQCQVLMKEELRLNYTVLVSTLKKKMYGQGGE